MDIPAHVLNNYSVNICVSDLLFFKINRCMKVSKICQQRKKECHSYNIHYIPVKGNIYLYVYSIFI